MKKLLSNPPAALAMACMLAISTFATAQDDGQPSGDQDQDPMEQTVDINFSGGSVRDYTRFISQNAPKVNIVVTKAAEDYPLPQIILKDVSVGAALNCLSYSTNDNIGLSQGDYGEVMYVVRYYNEQPTHVSVSNVGYLLDFKPKEDLLAAVEIGMDLMDTSELDVQMKLHEETGLLFVKGTDAQIELIDNIISEMKRDLGPGSGPGGGFGRGGGGGGGNAGASSGVRGGGRPGNTTGGGGGGGVSGSSTGGGAGGNQPGSTGGGTSGEKDSGDK